MKMLAYLQYLEREAVELRKQLLQLPTLNRLEDINRATILQITAYIEYGHKPTRSSTNYIPYILTGIFSCGCTYLNGDLIIANTVGLIVLIWWLFTKVNKPYIKWPTYTDNIDKEKCNKYLRRIRFHMNM